MTCDFDTLYVATTETDWCLEIDWDGSKTYSAGDTSDVYFAQDGSYFILTTPGTCNWSGDQGTYQSTGFTASNAGGDAEAAFDLADFGTGLGSTIGIHIWTGTADFPAGSTSMTCDFSDWYQYQLTRGAMPSAPASRLFKSEDGGYTWDDVGKVKVTIVDLVCSPTDADVLYYATTTDVYKSENAGRKFKKVADSPGAVGTGGLQITSLDVTYYEGDYMIVVGLADEGGAGDYGGVYLLDEGGRPFPVWEDQEVGGVPAGDGTGTVTGRFHVWDVAFSPNFEDDEQLLAVVSGADNPASPDHIETWVTTKMGGSGWNTTIADIPLDGEDDPDNNVDADDKAWICFPDDYDSDPDSGYYTLFVGVHADVAWSGVYQVLGDGEVALDLDVGGSGTDTDVTCLACAGPQDEAYLMFGTDADDIDDKEKVYRSTDSGDDWKACKKEPTGDVEDLEYPQNQVFVVVADDVADTNQAWVAVPGDDGGVSLQVDDRVWNTVGLIDYDIYEITDLSFSGDIIFMSTDDGEDCVWRYASNWERIFSRSLEDADDRDLGPERVQVSPYFAEDETVFIGDNDDDGIMRSTDGGNYFKQQIRAVPEDLEGWVIIDDETLIVGDEYGEVHKTTNNGRSWKTYTLSGAGDVEELVLAPGYATEGAEDEGHILAGDDEGHVYRSTDTGKNWSELKTSIMAESVIPAFDADYAENSTMYCTAEEHGVYRYVKGESTRWHRIDTLKGAPEAVTPPHPYRVSWGTGLVVSPDGTLYATDSDISGGIGEGISRSLDPTASKPFFERVNQTVEGDLTERLDGLWLTPGSNVLWSIFDPDDGNDQLYYLTDTLTVGVDLTSPANKKSSMRVTSVSFEWEEMPDADHYELQVATNEAMKGPIDGGWKTSSLETYYHYVIPEDLRGIPLYWRVRVYEQEPYLSRWSDVWWFSTQLTEAQWNPFVGGIPESPKNGATNVPLLPTFAWNAADWATGYEFVLSDKPDFSTIVSKTLKATVYQCETELGYSTTYYWRVRAVSASSQSEWATAVFTTMAKPVAPPPPVTVAPPAPAPAPIVLPTPIPAYLLWTIIGIGAVLMIVVIILTIRTRRIT